jgi:hypothetical protein
MLQSIPGPMIHDDDLLFLAIVPNWSRANRTTDTHTHREKRPEKKTNAQRSGAQNDRPRFDTETTKQNSHAPVKERKRFYKIETKNYDWK